MARWKLMQSHYLNTVKPDIWRYREVANGESIENEYKIPRLLDINDPKCWTNRALVGTPVRKGGSAADTEGEIIVCMPGKGQPGDIEFLGDPTPDMAPWDEEAEGISAEFAYHWSYKPDSPVTHSQSLVDRSVEVKPEPVQIAGMEGLVQAMEVQSRLISELLAPKSPDQPARRI